MFFLRDRLHQARNPLGHSFRVFAAQLAGAYVTGVSVQPKVLHASACELEAVARGLDAVREHLCQECEVLEVEESLRVGGK
ncbi:MAG: hypothetical protein HY716_06240 [Planctomycetes bacterium]|nr:hypothetical protein [Planctomycetota bacterium]